MMCVVGCVASASMRLSEGPAKLDRVRLGRLLEVRLACHGQVARSVIAVWDSLV